MQERYSEEVKSILEAAAAAGCNELSAGAVMCAYFSGLKQQ